MSVTPYDPVQTPPSGSPDAIRWPPYHPNGRPAPHGHVVANIAKTLAGRRVAQAPQVAPPEPVTIELKKCARTDDGVRLVDRPSLVAIPTRSNERPSKFPASPISGPDALASFLAGQEAYETLPDKAVFEAMRDAIVATGAAGRDLRDICDSVAIAVCARRGCPVSANQLPWE